MRRLSLVENRSPKYLHRSFLNRLLSLTKHFLLIELCRKVVEDKVDKVVWNQILGTADMKDFVDFLFKNI